MRRTGDRYTSASSDAIAWLTDDVLRVEGFDVQIDPGLMAETSLVVDPRDEPLDYNWQDWMHPSCVEVVVDGHAFVWDRQRFGSYMYTDPTMPDELFQAYWVEGVAPKLKEAEDRALGLDEE